MQARFSACWVVCVSKSRSSETSRMLCALVDGWEGSRIGDHLCAGEREKERPTYLRFLEILAAGGQAFVFADD